MIAEDDVQRHYTLPRGPKTIILDKEKKATRDKVCIELGLGPVENGTMGLNYKIGTKT